MKRLTVAVALTATTALALTGCAKKSTDDGSSSSGSGTTTVRVLISGDTNVQDLWTKGIVPGFEKAHPNIKVKVDLDLHGEHDAQNLAKIAAAVKGNNDSGMDLIDGGFVVQAGQSGLIVPADPAAISGLSDVPADVIKAGNGAIPYRGSSVLLAYNSTKIANPPTTLDDLLAWVKANKGQFTYNSPKSGGSGGSFVNTVLDKYLNDADQATLRTTYDQSLEAKWDKGFAELKSLNPYVYQSGVYPNGNAQVLQLLAGGSIQMAPVWSDQFISGQKSGQIPATIKATQISGPSFTGGAAYLGIPKNATNKAAALTLASYVLTPEAQNVIATAIAGYPVIPLDKLPAQTQEIFKAAHPDNLRAPYFSQVTKDMNKAWDDEVPGT